MKLVKLIGLDFGTTTSSAVIASAQLLRNSVTGRTELSQLKECFRSEIVFTPLIGDRLDEPGISRYLDDWLAAGIDPTDTLFGGGALLTGLTAQKENADTLIHHIRQRIGDAVIASANDPRLEAWLAFMGGCDALSHQHPDIPFINLDIGGGTTNLALGRNGEILSTSCLFIGARHVEVVPGSYRIVRLSPYALRLFELLNIRKDIGDTLDRHEIDAILDQYIRWLVAAVSGQEDAFTEPIAQLHEQIPFRVPQSDKLTVVTLSGGVGELVYSAVQGRSLPPTTAFGDLGIDFAEYLIRASPWLNDFRHWVPSAGGRATAFGLLRHNTQVSGSTLFISDPAILPLRDLPIFGTIDASLPAEQWNTMRELIVQSSCGGCVQVLMTDFDSASIRNLGERIAHSLRRADFPPQKPLVLIVSGNVGKTLGHYVTQWGTLPLALIVLDEVAIRDARFVHIGRTYDHVVSIAYYGLQT